MVDDAREHCHLYGTQSYTVGNRLTSPLFPTELKWEDGVYNCTPSTALCSAPAPRKERIITHAENGKAAVRERV